jgi:hypothetical protein
MHFQRQKNQLRKFPLSHFSCTFFVSERKSFTFFKSILFFCFFCFSFLTGDEAEMHLEGSGFSRFNERREKVGLPVSRSVAFRKMNKRSH